MFLKELFGAKPASVTEGGGFEVHVLGPPPCPIESDRLLGLEPRNLHFTNPPSDVSAQLSLRPCVLVHYFSCLFNITLQNITQFPQPGPADWLCKLFLLFDIMKNNTMNILTHMSASS